jgi:diguanylate cyclase (GGDEF)-like protein
MSVGLRLLYRRTALIRAALVVFLLTVALLAAVVVTLDHNAGRANAQQASADLTAAARVSASAFATVRADLRANASQLAASPALQRALLTGDRAALRAIAKKHHAVIATSHQRFDRLPRRPRLLATARVASGAQTLAWVTLGLEVGRPLLTLLEQATPLPTHGSLIFVRQGKVVAGGPQGVRYQVQRGGQVLLGSEKFAARGFPIGTAGTRVFAIEPVAAIDARTAPYRRRLLMLAALTLALVAGLALRLARPLMRLFGEASRLRRQARTDALTGLLNRRAFDDRLGRELETAGSLGYEVTLVMCDLDRFKHVNDTYGHPTGDEVLRTVARIVAESVRERDIAARYGGEELVLVLPGTPLIGGRRLSERIRRSLEEAEIVTADGETIGVTASFGAASFPTHSSPERLLAAADQALYEAKRAGRNRVITATAKKKLEAQDVEPVTAEPAAAAASTAVA